MGRTRQKWWKLLLSNAAIWGLSAMWHAKEILILWLIQAFAFNCFTMESQYSYWNSAIYLFIYKIWFQADLDPSFAELLPKNLHGAEMFIKAMQSSKCNEIPKTPATAWFTLQALGGLDLSLRCFLLWMRGMIFIFRWSSWYSWGISKSPVNAESWMPSLPKHSPVSRKVSSPLYSSTQFCKTV